MIRAFLVFFILVSSIIFSQKKLNLIPYPQKVQINEGNFTIPDIIMLNSDLPKEETEYFKKKGKLKSEISKFREIRCKFGIFSVAEIGKFSTK